MMLILCFSLFLLLSSPTTLLCSDTFTRNDFPADFVFGSGTSAYQVEGAAMEDGRTPSIWDTFTHSGIVRGNGDVASDGYHKYKEEVILMVDTGLDSPSHDGRGTVNPKGVEYYNNLINELVRNAIMHDDAPPDGFPVTPWGLQGVLEYFKSVYGNPPIYIHENGQKTDRTASLNDTSRVEYLRGYIGSMLDALRNGSNTRGYFSWSFLDVFELWDGNASSYGLYYVDLNDKDLKRHPKPSAHWYTNFLKGGRINCLDGICSRAAETASEACSSFSLTV
ncbi:Glycoside hydrolase family 1, partial [Dillenia turbinata]